MADNKPTYHWMTEHKTRKDSVEKASDQGSLWKHVPGIVYTGAILLLTVVLGTEISKLFTSQSVLLQVLGWGGVSVVGFSAIASYFGKGDVYRSRRQQILGMVFWGIELFALMVGLLVAIADAWLFTGILVDVARFVGLMAVVVSAFGWGVIRWSSPDWHIIARKNRTEADLAVTLSEIQAQYALSDEMISIYMETARNEARRRAELDRSRSQQQGGNNNQQSNRNFDNGRQQNSFPNRNDFQRQRENGRDRDAVTIIPDLKDGRRELVAERPERVEHTGNGHNKNPNQ